LKKNKPVFSAKTAVIAGGSKGIGKATAKEIIKRGGNVCIIARNKKDLDSAYKELIANRINENQTIDSISCDTTVIKKLKPLLSDFIKKRGVPDYLINCVGYANPKRIQDLTFDEFKDNMEVNYFGQLVPVLIILPYFMKNKKGYIANCSSVSGYLGIMGYSTYTPTKFAILGLTESLRHELKPYNIGFSVLFPPDTKTPGFDKENKTKPEELSIMSEGGGLLTAEQVAEKFVNGIIKKKFYITPGQSGLLWRIVRHFPGLAHSISDRNKKNQSMLQAVELKYGIESPHYKHLQEIVEQDEKKSQRINDYQ